MQPVVILSSEATLDGTPRYPIEPAFADRLADAGAQLRTLTISPLRAGWDTLLPPDHYRSGNAPIEALENALEILRRGDAEVVEIRGEDALRSGYSGEERRAAMRIYPGLESVAEGYEGVARRLLAFREFELDEFLRARDALFENYWRTFHAKTGEAAPAERWLEPVTPLFRGIDCANPVVDFCGSLSLALESTARNLGSSGDRPITVAGVATAQLDTDGPDAISEIARFSHLRKALESAQDRAGLNIPAELRSGNLLLELYTCFPVIPLAFLLESGIARDLSGVLAVAREHALTVTGGMNLARGPWNNPALHGLIAMHHALRRGGKPWGLVHGNGGLGYRQGVAVLRAG